MICAGLLRTFVPEMSAEKIISDWKKKSFKPIYWLEGEEDYYIDKVIQYAEHHLLPESEAGFNLTVFYGRDSVWSDVVNACMRYPMFAERQVVLLKEAQAMKEIDKLESYIEKPLPSTLFIVGYKDKALDKRTRLAKLIKSHTVYFHSERIRDDKLQNWLRDYLASEKITMSDKGIMLIADHIGNNLSRIVNEIEKITVNLAGRTQITEEDIEQYVGVSKEFNAFELQEAIARKDLAKALRIIQYFDANPKVGSIQAIIPAIFGLFSRLYAMASLPQLTEEAVKPIFSNNIFATREAIQTFKRYQYEGIERAILILHEYNLRGIGINAPPTSHASFMKELVVKIMHG